jgi:UDP-N-acetylmuramyl tripeptide synthase
VGEPPKLLVTGMTTPDPVLMQAQFEKFVREGVTHCAVEASSIGIAEQRMAGTRIELALFTNFTQNFGRASVSFIIEYIGDNIIVYNRITWARERRLQDDVGSLHCLRHPHNLTVYTLQNSDHSPHLTPNILCNARRSYSIKKR